MTPIRPANPADLAAVQAIIEAAYAQYVPLIGRRPAPMEADHAAHIAAGQTHLAESADGALLGLIVFYPQDGAMHLDTVAVDPAAIGKGIGKALIAHCEAMARQAGLPRVDLYTNARMTANLSIYPRLGYRETDRRSEHGFDRVFFTKHLD